MLVDSITTIIHTKKSIKQKINFEYKVKLQIFWFYLTAKCKKNCKKIIKSDCLTDSVVSL